MTCVRTTFTGSRRRMPAGTMLLVACLALALAGCGGGAEDVQQVAQGEATSVADAPDWIEKLYPPPGAETSVTQAVQVNHTAVTPNRQVRLSINGTDVTAYAIETSPGLLVYDIDQPDAPIELGPGEHEATVVLWRVQPGVSEGVDSFDPDVREVLDSFSWTFNVL